ncbi:class I SAM-dependent methyltransferase [Rhizobium sp. WSM1274]|uniref:class I SAM-dependent methyltransferase n=1 Tax=Rhizobium sp. WSM1274 TaxID=3138254 RepID=UPI0021A33914|nr:class I SAM-dependent methyltransferase [Rhizobium leguminosarum]UWU29156.1 class I SAM-dependent methyltransferase [Rhizobium leguminosarum bv. viciae]
MEQRFTFDQVASVYKTSRPDYPEALIDDIVTCAELKPNDTVLEVGCGTGQATKSFATRDLQILALDPGPEMVRAARETLANFTNVELVEATFEAWPSDKAVFQLIIAAQSWHWVSPEVRFAKAAEVLSPDGSLAVFGHVPVGLPTSLVEQFKGIFLRHTGAWGTPPEAGYLPSGPFKGWFDEPKLFGPVEHRCYSWVWRHTTSSYINFLRTRSDVRMLTPAVCEELLVEIAKAIDGQEGEFDVDYETHLYVARRVEHIS